jgi:hypothetical protein
MQTGNFPMRTLVCELWKVFVLSCAYEYNKKIMQAEIIQHHENENVVI